MFLKGGVILRLIHDCVRDILLYLENELEYNGEIYDYDINLPKYSSEDIKYTLKKLREAKYINIDSINLNDEILVSDITFCGHQFLDNIRDDHVWSKTKSILSKFTSTSLSIVQNISAQVIADLISSSLK